MLASQISWLAHLQPHTHVLRSRLDPSSEEYVLEQLAECEQKLVGLVEELSSRDLDTILKEMEDEEVRVLGLKVLKVVF